MKTNLIETRRRHLVRAKLDSMMRRTGSYFQLVKMDDGTTLPVELDEDILTKSLIKSIFLSTSSGPNELKGKSLTNSLFLLNEKAYISVLNPRNFSQSFLE